MSTSRDIIGIVKELQERHRLLMEAWTQEEAIRLSDHVFAYFPAIAAHVLDREEKLRAMRETWHDFIAYECVGGVCNVENCKHHLARFRLSYLTIR